MTRLIDADALLHKLVLEKVDLRRCHNGFDFIATMKELKILCDEYHQAITNAPTIQREGWVSVPIEPTPEMIKNIRGFNDSLDRTFKLYYQKMISAAPKE
jgi:hypothetical protein